MASSENKKVEPSNTFGYPQYFKGLIDCYVTVGDPNSGTVEKIGVPRGMLLAHSSVFRDMFNESELADPTGHCTHITDVEPGVFKLMLRHMFRCLEDPEDIPEDLALPLAFFADKYNVQSLLNKACQALTPSGVCDIFPALHCMTFISVSPSLEQSVIKIIQTCTDELIEHSKFVELDEKLVELVAKQEMLAVTEIQLWEALVKWAKYQQGKSKTEVTLREQLTSVVKFVRLATLSDCEVVDKVIPVNVFTPLETMVILCAINTKKSFELPGLNGSNERRRKIRSEEDNMSTTLWARLMEQSDYTFEISYRVGYRDNLE